jgi:multidrug efflux pump subunit AcrA (membrane-fusion protein)
VLYLQNPGDQSIAKELSDLRSQLESAKASLRARQIVSPIDGVVKEILVRDNQRVDPGKVVATIAVQGAPDGMSVLAFLPGADRPRLFAGQRLRLSLPGYRGAYLDADVRAVSTEVLGAAEAKEQFLGGRFGDAIPVNGSVVVVEAVLAETSFVSDGEQYDLHDGMAGRVEVQLDSKSVLETLIPGVGDL